MSYSTEDREFAEQLIGKLRRSDIVANSAPLPENPSKWFQSVYRDIKEADAVIVLVGRESEEWQRREWKAALEEKWQQPDKQLIPVLLDDVDLPAFLSEYPPIKVDRAQEGAIYGNLVRRVREGGGEASPVTFKPSTQWKERLDYIGKVANELKK